MEEHVLKNVRIFCNCMQDRPDPSHQKVSASEWSSARNMSIWTGRLMFDIMGDVAFGRSFRMLESDTYRQFLNTLSDGVHGLNLVSGTSPLRLNDSASTTNSDPNRLQRSGTCQRYSSFVLTKSCFEN